MKKKHVFSLIVLIFLMTSGFIFSKNYYIDASGGNDSNSGLSPSTAWKSLTKLNNSWSIIAPGDSILFKRGETWRPSGMSVGLISTPNSGLFGTSQSPIVIGAYGSGAKPIISSGNSPSVPVFNARNIAYVTIQDIEFRGLLEFMGSFSISNDSIDHIRMLRLTVDGGAAGDATGGGIDCYAPAVEGAAEVWDEIPIHDIELGYSVIKNTSERGINLYGYGNNWIHNNQFYNTGKGAIDLAEGDNDIIEYNVISGAKGPGIKHSVHSHTSKNLIIRGNLILNTIGGIDAYNLINAKIYNNTIRVFNNESSILGWTAQSPVPLCGKGTTQFQGCYIQNNIFDGGPLYIWRAVDVEITYKDGTDIQYKTDDIRVNNIIQNNIIYNPYSTNQIYVNDFIKGTHCYYDASTPGTYARTLVTSDYYINSSNFSSSWASGYPNESGDMSADPLFVNDTWTSAQNFGDFHLRSNSPGYGAGVPESDYKYDLNGISVSASGSPDIGALQSGTAADVTPPSLTSANLTDQNTLVLKFSEKVNSNDAQTVGNYSISNGISISSAALSSDQTQVTLTTSTHSYGVNYTVTAQNIHDLSGNLIDNSADSKQYSIAAPADVTPPSLLSANLTDPSTLVLKFSEKVNTSDAQNAGNYNISDNGTASTSNLVKAGEGDFETGTGSWVAYGNNTISISTDYANTGTHSLKITYVDQVGGAYLPLSGTADLSSNLVVGNTYSVSFWAMATSGSPYIVISGGGLSPIVYTGITGTFQKYQLQFTATSPDQHILRCSSMGSGQSIYIDNLQVTDVNGSTAAAPSAISINSAVLSSDQTQVTLSTAPHSYNVNYTVTANNIHDLAGNIISPNANSEAYSISKPADVTPPALDSAKLSNQNTLVLAFSEKIDSLDAINTANFTISNGISVSKAVLSADQTQVTLTTSTHTYDLKYTVTAANIHDLAGNLIDPNANSVQYFIPSPPDTTAPTLVSAAAPDSTTLVLKFSEKIKSSDAQTLSDYSISGISAAPSNLFKPGKGDFENGTESWTPYGSNTISTSTDYASTGTHSLKVTYVNGVGGAYLYFNSGSDLSSDLVVGKTYVVTFWACVNSGSAYMVIAGGGLSPIVYTGITTTFQKYQLQFTATSANQHIFRSSSLNTGQILYLDNIQIMEAGAVSNTPQSVAVKSAVLSSDQTQVTLSTGTENYNTQYTVKANNIHDLAGNIISPNANSEVYSLSKPADVTPPALDSAKLSNQNTLVLAFSEKIDSLDAINTANFTISNGISVSKAVLSADQSQVTLTTSTHTYDLKYTVTAANIHDLAGNLIDPNANSVQYFIPSPPDTTAPTLVSAAASDSTTLVLKFSEKIKSSDAQTLSNYSISGTASAPSNLFKPGKGDFENGTESWTAYGNNTISTSTDYASTGTHSLKVTYVNSVGGAYLYFNANSDLSSDLVVGKTYVVTFWACVNSGSAYMVIAGGGLSPIVYTGITATFQKYQLKFTATSPNLHIFRSSSLRSGQILYLDNLQIAESGAVSQTPAPVSINSAVISSDQTQVTLTTSPQSAGVKYTVAANNIHDLAGNLIAPDANSQSYSISSTASVLSKIQSAGVDKELDKLPDSYQLVGNYPNPFNPSTRIVFNIPESSYVTLKVYNILGQLVATLLNDRLAAGRYQINFDASKLSSGIYIYSLSAGKFNFVKKMILTK